MSNVATHTSERPNGPSDVGRETGLHKGKNAIEAIAEALRSSGYRSLDQQANALGLHRATTWTIIRNKHKIGRLSKKTTNRILTNPKTPRAVRVVVRRYLAEQIEVAR
jgi:hypothetical protein